MRSHVADHSRLLICVPASHSRMHSALFSATTLLLVRRVPVVAVGAGVVAPVWANATPALKTRTTKVAMTRIDLPRKSACSVDGHSWMARGVSRPALGPHRDLCV